MSLLRTFRAPLGRRYISAFGYTQCKVLVHSEYGAPKDVLKLHSYSVPPASYSDLNIRFIATPLNPADINQIEGVYPTKPPMTLSLGTPVPSAVPGNEGVVSIASVGANVKGFKPGDRALMRHSAFGTWRTHAVATEKDLLKIPERWNGIDDIAAATVSVNPCTAYRMLRDFVKLEVGDWFIQNGSNSGVGRAAVQLGKIWGYKSINIVRDRPGVEELKKELTELGADLVVTEDELGRKFGGKVKELTGGKGIKLGLNCVGGKKTTDMLRLLGTGAHLVTYGGMSKGPVTVPTSAFIFKDLHCHGFWVSRWSDQNPEKKMEMLEDLFGMAENGYFALPPVEKNVWKYDTKEEELKAVVEKTMQGFGGKKQVWVFEEQ